MCGSMVTKSMHDKREAEYRAEEDHRTLQRAAEVRNDAKRMKGAADHHRKKTAEMASVGRQLGVPSMPLRMKKSPARRAANRSLSTGR